MLTNYDASGIWPLAILHLPWKIPRPYCMFSATNGSTYYFQLNGPFSFSETPTNIFRFHLVASTSPVISDQPASLTVSCNGSALLKLATASLTPASIQWQFNGADIPGANVAVLPLTNVVPAQAGDYRAIVRNASGSVTSAPAHLWITVVDQPPILSVLPGFYAERFAFALGGEPGRAYRIESSTNLLNWAQENSFDSGSIDPPFVTTVILNNGFVSSLDLPKTGGQKCFRASAYAPSNEICNLNLKIIRFAKDLWARERNYSTRDTPQPVDLFGSNAVLNISRPQCPQGGWYYYYAVGSYPTCTIPGHVLEEPP